MYMTNKIVNATSRSSEIHAGVISRIERTRDSKLMQAIMNNPNVDDLIKTLLKDEWNYLHSL